MNLRPDDPLAAAAVTAIREGNLPALERLLNEHPELVHARIDGRTLLHVATDWPGHFPNGPATVALLVDRGADVNAPGGGRYPETPLHWAASSDDVAVLDALLDLGANIEATGGVIGNGTPLADAVAFGQWRAARRLIERGAKANLWQAAALGLVEQVRAYLAADPPPTPQEVTQAFWCACHGGQPETAALLLERGANLNWVGYDQLTPLDAALREGHHQLATWLRQQGARSVKEGAGP